MKAKKAIKVAIYPKERLRGYDMEGLEVKETVLGTEYINVVELFKKNFSKDTRELWNILENPKGRTSEEILEQTNLMINALSFLKDTIVEAEEYEEE